MRLTNRKEWRLSLAGAKGSYGLREGLKAMCNVLGAITFKGFDSTKRLFGIKMYWRPTPKLLRIAYWMDCAKMIAFSLVGTDSQRAKTVYVRQSQWFKLSM